MALSINTNVASIVARNNLSNSQMSLQTAMQRLSSGLRINSAADDAAGYAISQRMTSQIGGLDQAARNANDGISLAQTAQGALSQITQNLQTVRNLAVQAANGSNSASDRAALNNQASQLIAENNRIAASANFNGVNLLDGTFSGQTFQVGANGTSNDQITIGSISSALSSALGVGSNSAYSTSVTGTAVTSAALTAGQLTINGYQVGATTGDGVSNTNASASGIAKAAAINAITAQTGVTATVSSTTVTGAAAVGAGSSGSGALTINGVSVGTVTAGTSGVTAGAAYAAAINSVSSQTGVTATADSSGKITLTAADGRNVTVANGADAGLTDGTSTSKITLTSTNSSGITVADGTGGGSGIAGLTVGNTAATVTVGAGVSSVDLTTASGATSALATIDAALQSVNTSAAALGAYQNRFQSAVSSLQTYSQNLQTSRSRIQDTDFAAETANMTRAQVLQQAGTAILAQANSAPNGILALLR
jgi:flagellin